MFHSDQIQETRLHEVLNAEAGYATAQFRGTEWRYLGKRHGLLNTEAPDTIPCLPLPGHVLRPRPGSKDEPIDSPPGSLRPPSVPAPALDCKGVL